MREDHFVPPNAAFTRSVPIRFSHCDPAGIVYFPHYFDMFNGLIEDWYGQELGYDYAELITGRRFGFPFVHIECDFKISKPNRRGDRSDFADRGDRPLIACDCHYLPQREYRAAARAHGHRDDVAGEQKGRPDTGRLAESIAAYRRRTATIA